MIDKDNSSRVLITGGSGFIGTNLMEHYINAQKEVVNIDIKPPRNSAHAKYWLDVDLLDSVRLKEAIEEFRPTVILHMGARTDLEGASVDDYSANTIGVQNLIEAISRVPVERVIFASSRLVCRIGYEPRHDNDYCPTTSYGYSKVLGEKIVRRESHRIRCPWVIVRPTSIWGPWFDVPYRSFFDIVSKGRYFHPGNQKIYKTFGFVGNVVHEIERLLHVDEHLVNKRTLYLADYEPIELKRFSEMICKEFNGPKIRSVPVFMLRLAAGIGDVSKTLGWKNPPLTSFRLNNLLTPMVHDLSELKKIVGPLPYPVEEGVSRTVGWLKTENEKD